MDSLYPFLFMCNDNIRNPPHLSMISDCRNVHRPLCLQQKQQVRTLKTLWCLTCLSTVFYLEKPTNRSATKGQGAAYVGHPCYFRQRLQDEHNYLYKKRQHLWLCIDTFLALFELAISAAFPSALAILLETSFPGGLCSMGLFMLLMTAFPWVFFTCFLLCFLKCASCRVVSSLLS